MSIKHLILGEFWLLVFFQLSYDSLKLGFERPVFITWENSWFVNTMLCISQVSLISVGL